MPPYPRLLCLAVSFILLLPACKKDAPKVVEPPVYVPPKPLAQVSSFVITDPCQRKVKITGKNFEPDKTKDSVFFGSQKGIIDSASATEIIATFPQGDISAQVIVYCAGLAAVAIDQKLIFGTPVIKSFSPAVAGPGAVITITGKNFNTNINSDSVFFNGIKARVLSVDTNNIVAVIPKGENTSGTITVFSNCQQAVSKDPFTLSNQGVVFVAGTNGYCYAIDIASRTAKWKKQTFSVGFAGPTYDNGMVFIGTSHGDGITDNFLYGLDAFDGEEIWRLKAGVFGDVPLVNNDVVYAGSADGRFYAVNKNTGSKLWNFTVTEPFLAGSPLYADGLIYTPNDQGYLYCLNASDGSMQWKLPIWASGNPAISNGTIYTAGFDSVGSTSYLFALDAKSGATKWKYAMHSLSGSSATIDNGIVYIGTGGHQVYAINAMTGELVWRTEVGWYVSSAAIVEEGVLYISIADGSVNAIDATSGDILWERFLPGDPFGGGFSPVMANGVLYVGDYSGMLNALDPKTGETIWMFNTGPRSVRASPCVVDAAGNVYHAGDSGNRQ